MTSESPQPYRVLARKYRPASFDALIGQDAMVRTLGNAIARGKIAHAFLLTGVRGVGKTSTARIIAKALNCIGPDGTGGPTINPCGICEPCRAIAESRHIDVMEMDAASRTGVDDVREIIDAVQYSAVSARYKVYIIDEVHMLTKNAFNALLKTLEEPPPHVKFIFATTEIHKVPVTVLSRCQRFDLRRITADMLSAHFSRIAEAENVDVEPEALALIARAAEGSVRDGLSLLDQAIAHGGGRIEAQAVRDMLGLSDRGRVRALLASLLAGDGAAALANLREQYDLGTSPDMVIEALLDLVHGITRAKVAGAVDPGMSAEEREASEIWAAQLGMGALHRIWQLLLKGLADVHAAPVPIQAAEMALLRIVYASSLPDPGNLIRRLQAAEDGPFTGEGAPGAGVAGNGSVGAEAVAGDPALLPVVALNPPTPLRAETPRVPIVAPADFSALVRLFEAEREPLLAKHLHDDVRLVRYAPPHVEFRPLPGAGPDLAGRVSRCLSLWTGERWVVSLSEEEGAPTLRDVEIAAAEAARAEVLAHPTVHAVLEAFPNAELLDYGIDDADAAEETVADEIRRQS